MAEIKNYRNNNIRYLFAIEFLLILLISYYVSVVLILGADQNHFFGIGAIPLLLLSPLLALFYYTNIKKVGVSTVSVLISIFLVSGFITYSQITNRAYGGLDLILEALLFGFFGTLSIFFGIYYLSRITNLVGLKIQHIVIIEFLSLVCLVWLT